MTQSRNIVGRDGPVRGVLIVALWTRGSIV